MEFTKESTEIKCLKPHEMSTALCFIRAERFMDGYSYIEEYLKLIKKYFGDIEILFKEGLRSQFFKLKQKVINEKCIGLILCATISDCEYQINNYKTIKNDTIKLTTKSISNRLLNDYFTEEEIIRECFNTPSFHVYYNQ